MSHRIIPPGKSRQAQIPNLPTDFFIEGQDTGSRFALLQHTLAPGYLGAPPHRHRNEDEYSYVLAGELTVQLGEDVLTAGPGTTVFKPRAEVHAFWNQGQKPVRFLEIISPSGFEHYFDELAAIDFQDSPEAINKALAALGRKYHLEFFMERVPALLEKYNLRL